MNMDFGTNKIPADVIKKKIIWKNLFQRQLL